MLCYAGFSVLLTKVRSLIHEEILLLSVLKFPFRVLTPLRSIAHSGYDSSVCESHSDSTLGCVRRLDQPLLRTTNAAIGNFAPNVYLTEPSIVGNQPVDPTIANHLIDRQIVLKPFSPDLYDKFITSRKRIFLRLLSGRRKLIRLKIKGVDETYLCHGGGDGETPPDSERRHRLTNWQKS
jgi:hypothetical protein